MICKHGSKFENLFVCHVFIRWENKTELFWRACVCVFAHALVVFAPNHRMFLFIEYNTVANTSRIVCYFGLTKGRRVYH